MTQEKLSAICIVLLIATSPFFFWLILYFANPRSQDELKTQISRVKRLRWVLYFAGVALGVFWIIDHMPNHYWIFGSAVIVLAIDRLVPRHFSVPNFQPAKILRVPHPSLFSREGWETKMLAAQT